MSEMVVTAEGVEQREQRSFDLLAAVNMLRYDQQHYGGTLPETRRRILDEDLSFMAEVADSPARTNFALGRGTNEELLYFNQNQWTSYTGMLVTGLEVARQEARHDPRRSFLADWAARDLQIGYQMRALQPGQRLSWTNGYPHDVAARYGEQFMRDCGLRPDRRMGFLYQAVCHEDGTVELWSQTIDRSDTQALQAVERAVQYDPDLDIDGMLRVYDGTLRKQHGGNFYAGSTAYEKHENVWQRILAQEDLINYYMEGLERIADSPITGRTILEQKVKEHVIGAWVLFEKRFKGLHAERGSTQYVPLTFQQLDHLAQVGVQEFVDQNRALVGCGGDITIAKNGNLNSMDMTDARDAIFGGSSSGGGAENYSFTKHMYCVVCQAPPEDKAAKKMCGPCGICKECDGKIQVKNAASGVLSLIAS